MKRGNLPYLADPDAPVGADYNAARTIALERKTLGMNVVLPGPEQISCGFDAGRALLIFKKDMWTERFHAGRETVEIGVEVPASWWEHVKERFAPRWFLRRWPVVTRTLIGRKKFQFTREASYPSLPITHFGDNHAYAVVNTVHEIPRCRDVSLSDVGDDRADQYFSIVNGLLYEAVRRAEEESDCPVGFLAVSERTWEEFQHAARRAGVLFVPFGPGVARVPEPPRELFGRTVRIDDNIPPGIFRVVAY